MTWRIPRFTTLQLLLGAALCAIVLGLATASWRTSTLAQVTAVKFSPGGEYLAARYASGHIQVWEMRASRPRLVASITSTTAWAYDNGGLHFAGNQTLIDVPTRWDGAVIHGDVRSLDLASGSIRSRLAVKATDAGVRYAAGGDTLAAHDWSSGTVHCYSLGERRLVTQFKVSMPAWGFALTPNGKTLVVPDLTGILVCDVAAGRIAHQEATPGATTVAISPDGRRLAFVDGLFTSPKQALRVRDLATGDLSDVAVLDVPAATWIEFTADGTRLAIADHSSANLYDVRTRRRVGRVVFDRVLPVRHPWRLGAGWQSHSGRSHFSLAPDGSSIASFDRDRVHVWDLTSGKLRYSVGGGSRTVQIVLFTALLAMWSAAWGIVSRREHERGRRGAEHAAAPIELKLCWGMMLIGGFFSLALPIWLLFVQGPLLWPMFYLAFLTGVAAVARGAARDPRNLPRIATMQVVNITACDPVNFVLGILEHALLARPHVQAYLRQLQRPPFWASLPRAVAQVASDV